MQMRFKKLRKAGRVVKSRYKDVVFGEKYRVIRKLGQGGFSQVFEAEHLTLGKKVAIKVLARGGDPKRFKSEARSLARLEHQHIVNVMDYGQESDGTLYFVMEYAEGKTLDQIIQQHFPLPLKNIESICKQICQALQYIHENKCIHRDLKPANLLVKNEKSPTPFVKIFDFGIAKNEAEKDSELINLTTPGLTFGTPYYMSPEQIRGQKNIDHRTDIYSFGTILYELFEGSPPYKGKTRFELLEKHLNSPPPSIKDPRASKKLQLCLEHLLAKRPKHRPADIAQVWSLLSHAFTTCDHDASHSKRPSGNYAKWCATPEDDVSNSQPSHTMIPRQNQKSFQFRSLLHTSHSPNIPKDNSLPNSQSGAQPSHNISSSSQQKDHLKQTNNSPHSSTSDSIQENPSNKDWVNTEYAKGLSFGKNGQFKKAQKCMERILQVNTKHFAAHYNLGLALANQKDYAYAEQAFRVATQLKPSLSPPHYNLGIALSKQNKLNDAEQAFRRAISQEPENPSYHSELGTTLSKQKKFIQAENAFRKAIELNPNDLSSHFNLGIALFNNQQFKEAETIFRKAIQIDPNDPLILHHLAATLRAQNRSDEAKQILTNHSILQKKRDSS